MTEELIAQVLDYGALGVLAAFLIWQHIGMQKRMDTIGDRFHTQLDKLNSEYDDRVEVLRSRYDAVIEGIREESNDKAQGEKAAREQLQSQLVGKLDQVLSEVRMKSEVPIFKG